MNVSRKYWFVGDADSYPTFKTLGHGLVRSLSAPQETKQEAMEQLDEWELTNPRGDYHVYRADITLERR